MNKITEIAFSIPGGQSTDPTVNLNSVGGIPSGTDYVNLVIQWGLTLIFIAAGIVTLLFVIWGGISWIMSGGEKEKIQEARNKIVYALIGLIVIFSSYLIIRTVGGFFGIDPFELGTSHVACPGDPPANLCGPNPKINVVCRQGTWTCEHD